MLKPTLVYKNLKEISSYMRAGLKANNVNIIDSQTPIIPIYTYEDEKAFLQDEDFQ